MTPEGCRRRGWSELGVSVRDACGAAEPHPGEQEKDRGSADAGDRKSWLDIATMLAQVALDIIRVLREGTDLYRKIKLGT